MTETALDLSQLSGEELGALHSAIKFYARDLSKEANKLKDLGKNTEAGQLDGEVLGLQEEIIEPGAFKMVLYPRHVPGLRVGLEILQRVAKSSKGINLSIDEPESVDRSEAKAKLVKDNLIPKFAEQPDLGLVTGDAEDEQATS